jgi:hypothetical protein
MEDAVKRSTTITRASFRITAVMLCAAALLSAKEPQAPTCQKAQVAEAVRGEWAALEREQDEELAYERNALAHPAYLADVRVRHFYEQLTMRQAHHKRIEDAHQLDSLTQCISRETL